jgi:hypothetical protein
MSAMGRKRRCGRLPDPRPGLGLAADACKQAAPCHDGVLVLHGPCPREDLVEIGDENLSLPHSRTHFAELPEKLGANQIGCAAACGVSLCLVIRPYHGPTTTLAAWMDAHVDAVRGVAKNQVLNLLAEGFGRQEASRNRGPREHGNARGQVFQERFQFGGVARLARTGPTSG